MRMLLLASPVVPVLLALLAALAPTRRLGLALMPWAAIPAFVLALTAPDGLAVSLSEVLLDTRLTIDPTARAFLILTAFLWTAAGVYARTYTMGDPHRLRYAIFHLLTLSGNIALIVAADAATFYLGFAAMTFAGYGLIVHTATGDAKRAGRVYIVIAVFGEAMLLAGLALTASTSASLSTADMAAAVAGSPWRNAIVALLLGGFGIKAGAVPLHVWLPLAHPVAPTPASAVLSGCMIKAGLLGWLRFLPLGLVTLPEWGTLVIVLAVAAAFFGVVVGVTQRDPKTILAYSSISQMGLANLGVGIALAGAGAWPAALGATLVYVVHHGLTKGALFLGVGVAGEADSPRRRRLTMALLAFAAVSLAGAPLTSGSIAKTYLKATAPFAPALWPAALDVVLPLASLGSTLLMARFLILVWRLPAHAPGTFRRGSLWPPWLAVLAAVAFALWVLPARFEFGVARPGVPAPGAAWLMIWPVVAGALLAWLAAFGVRHWKLAANLYIRPGDVLVLGEAALSHSRRFVDRVMIRDGKAPVASIAAKWYDITATGPRDGLPGRIERLLTSERSAAVSSLLLILALLGMLWTR